MPNESKPSPRAPLRIDTIDQTLSQRLDNEIGVVDLLLSEAGRGQGHPEIWDRLHGAVLRDDRLAEMAFAYERLAQDKKLKALPAPIQADLWVHMGTFFADVFGDAEGAQSYLERALALQPALTDAFERLEKLFESRSDNLKLSDLYAAASAHRADKAEQLRLLKRAVELRASAAGEEERLVKLCQQVLKIEPGDREARRLLEERYAKTGKYADVARLLEQALAADPPLPGDEALEIHARLVGLYSRELREIERATPHVEEVLVHDSGHALSRKVAEELLSHKAVAARAAFALEGAYERTGALGDTARMLTAQIELIRGPKRIEAQRRLAVLKQDRLNDAAGAFTLYEAIVAVEPSDEEARRRFLALAASLEKMQDGVRVLSRALTGAKDPALRAHVGVELGEVLLAIGDAKRARAMLQTVIEGDGDAGAVLRAARALEPLATEAKDNKLLALVLEKLGAALPEPEARFAATLRLANLCEGELKDVDRAIGAYRKLLDTPRETEALEALLRLYEASGARDDLAGILERLAARERDPSVARPLAFRAAELRGENTAARGVALEAWRKLVATHGPARDAFARMTPLLEQEQLWDELATVLEADAAIALPGERGAVLARLANVRLVRLRDPRGALDAYGRALALDASDRTSRAAVEKLLAAGEVRLQAAALLEPIYRAEGLSAGLLKVLEARAVLSEGIDLRLAALREAALLAERQLQDPRRALELVAKGISEAVNGALGELPAWLSHLEELAPMTGDLGRRVEVLVSALGDRLITDPALADLARRTAQALEARGDAAGALAVYRRALAFEPSSAEILARVDALLREQGSPEERVALYRAALEQPGTPSRRREILHAIGAIQRRDLADPAAAIATYRRALDEDPADRVAYEALLDAHTAAGSWDDLHVELQRGLARAEGEERSALLLRIARLLASRGQPERAVAPYREVLMARKLGDDREVLDEIEKLADAIDDTTLLREVLERRVALAADRVEEATELEHLGEVLAGKLGDREAAVIAFRRGAELSEAAGDVAKAVGLYESVLAASPDDYEAASQLAALYKRTGAWDRLPRAYAVLLRAAKSEADATDLVLALEAPAVQARAVDAFLAAAGDVLARRPSPERTTALLSAKARVLASDPARQDGAAEAYRAVIEGSGDGWGAAADAFEAFLVARPERHADRRWLLALRAERAAESERVRALLIWAAFEENVLGELAAAADVYVRVLAVEPDNDDALAARARLLLKLGDAEGAAEAISARRDRSEGSARIALDLELAALFLDHLGKPDEALAAVAGVLEAAPTDEAAIRIARGALSHEASRTRAAGLLEKASEASEDPTARAEILEVLLSAPHDAKELAAGRRRWFEGLLDIHASDSARVFEIALRSVRELPHESALWERTEALARELERPDAVAAAYRAAIADPTTSLREPEAMEEIGRRAVDYQEEWFEDSDAVVALLRQVLALAPAASWAFDRLKLVYNAGERWPELLALYDTALSRTLDVAVRSEILEDAAQIAKDFAAAPERAIRYLEELQRIKKSDVRVRASLERLYERYGHHRPLVELLEGQLAVLEGEPVQRLRLKIAGLWLDGLRDAKSAFAVVEAVLAAEPERDEAFDLLERILVLEPASRREIEDVPVSRKGPSIRARAAALLEARYRSRGKMGDLVRILQIELETVSRKKERARRLRELAKLRIDELGDEVGALEDTALLVALDPTADEPRRELARLAEKTGSHARHADVLTAVASEVKEPNERAALLMTAAEIVRDRLADRARAIALYREVLTLANGEATVELGPARELDALFAAAGRDAERCDVLELLGAIEPEAAARRRALGEVAELASKVLGDPARAIRVWRLRLDADPKDREAIDGLVRELEHTGAWRDLTSVLLQRAALSTSVEARRDRADVARILQDRLDERDEAIAAWISLRADLGADEESCEALALLLEQAGRHTDLIELYEREAGSATTPDRRAAMWRRAGDFHRHREALDLATLSYESALEADVRDERAQRGLEAVLASLGDADRDELANVVAVLERAYSAVGDEARLVGLLEPRLRVTAKDADRVRILTQTAAMLEARGDASAAFDVLWRAFAIAPAEKGIAEAVIRTASGASRWDTVAASMKAVLDARADVPPETARALCWHVGLHLRDERHDPEAAEEAFDRALSYGDADVEILRALADLRRRSRDRALVTTLLRLADATGGDLDLVREAADTAADHVHDRALALSIAEKLFELAVVRFAAANPGEEAPSEAHATLLSAGAWTSADLGVAHATELGQDAPGAATWALEFMIKTAHDAAERERVVTFLLRGAELPFGAMKSRALRLSAADLAEPARGLAIYQELFSATPTDELVVGRLEGALRTAGLLVALADLRKQQVAVATTPERRVELRFDSALFLAEAGDAPAAIAALRENLEEVPGHTPSVTRLAVLYEASALTVELAALLEEQAAKREAAGDRDAAAAWWMQAAKLAESSNEMPRAIRGYRRAVAAESLEAHDHLARLHGARGEHASAAEILERLFERTEPARAPEVVLRLADAYAHTGEADLARARLEKALEMVPDSVEVAARLADLYRIAEAWGPLAHLVAKSADDAPDRATRLARLREAADLHVRRRGDAAAAIPLLEQASALAPEDLAIRLAMCDAMCTAGRFEDAATILKAMIEGYGARRPKERALVHHQLARLSLALGDRARALGELDAASKIDPAHPAILHALARLALEEGQLDRAERSFRALLLVVRRGTQGGAGPTVARAEVLLELSAIAERQGQTERAAELVESVFEEARDSAPEMEELVRALRASGNHAALARALELALAISADGPGAATVLHELATVYEEHLGRSEAALDARLRALTLSPDAQALHDAALALTRRTGGVDKYVAAVSDLVAKSTEPRRSAKLLLCLGRALETELSDDSGAAAAYARAEEQLAGDEGDGAKTLRLDVWRAMERVHRRRGDVAHEAEVLEKRLAVALGVTTDADRAARAEGLYRLAELKLADAAARDAGAALLEEAVLLDPDPSRAETALRAAIAAGSSERLLSLLESFARRTGRSRALVDSLVLRAADGSAEAFERMREAAGEAAKLGDRPLAESLVERLVADSRRRSFPDLARANADLAAVFIALAELRQKDSDLAGAVELKERAAKLVDPGEERALLMDVARAAQGPLADFERAARIYEELRRREPADREIWAPLADVYRSLGDHTRLSALLEATSELVDAPEERIALRLERAMISVRSAPDLAMKLLREIIEEDPSEVDAAMLLSGMFEERGEFGELATLLARQLDGAKDREDKTSVISLSTRLGALLEQQGDAPAALDVYRGALDWDPSSRDALRAIVRLSIERDSLDLGDALVQLLTVTEGQEAVDLALQLAEFRTANGDQLGVEHAIAMGFAACPSSELLRDELIRRYTERAAWRELADVHLRDAAVRATPEERATALLRAAAVLRDRAEDPAAAAEILQSALDVLPADHGVLGALIAVYTAMEEPQRGIDAMSRAIEVAPDDVWLYQSRASLHREMSRVDLSIADLQIARKKSGDEHPAELIADLEIALAVGGVGGYSVRDLRLSLAEVLSASGNVEGARMHLAELVNEDNKDRAALRALAALEERLERWDAASATLRRLLGLEDGDTLIQTALRLAAACTRADRLPDARAGLERALKIAPANAEVRDLLRKVYNETGASRELAEMILEDARVAVDVAGRFAHLIHAGRLLIETAEDAPQALAVLEEARSLRPEEQEGALLLAEAYAVLGRSAESAALLEEAVAAHKGRRSKQLALVYVRMAAIEQAAHRDPQALAALLKAFDSDPHNGALAMRLGLLAVSLGEREIAARVFRSISLMKPIAPGTPDGASPEAKAVAYFHLGRLAQEQGDHRKARLMLDRAVAEDPSLEEARTLLSELRGS